MNWNEEQLKILQIRQGILRLFGGPGTGKTVVLLNLAAEILTEPGLKDDVLVIASTLENAHTLEKKLFDQLGNNPVKFTTFHTLARENYPKSAKLISEYQIGLLVKKILSDFQSPSLLKRVLVSPKLIRELADFLKLLRLNLITPDDIPDDKSDILLHELQELYRRLETEISNRGFMTEQDMLMNAADNFHSDSRAVFVLNAQDITPVEYHFLKSISLKSKLTALSGDPYRNIHRFEGGDPEIMRRRLESDYPDLQTVHFKKSYKIGGKRLEFAERIFDPEAAEFLPSEGRENDIVYYHEYSSPIEETNAIANTIENLVRVRKIPSDEIGIALRAPGVTGSRFKRALNLKNIPCTGGDSPFIPPVVREFIEKIKSSQASDRNRDHIAGITNKYIRDSRENEHLCQALKIAGSLIEDSITITGGDDWEDMIDIVVEEFLSRPFPSKREGVHITSIHAARGNSFKVVFLPGLVENGFPAEVEYQSIFSPKWMDDFRGKIGKPLSYLERADIDKHLNEERRLFYTGMCLAEDELYLSRALSSNGEMINPSIFLTETGILPVNPENTPPSTKIFAGGFLSAEDSLSAEVIKILQVPDSAEKAEILEKLEDIADQIDLETLKKNVNQNLQTNFTFELTHLSAGALNTYLYCPRKFFYSYALRLPMPTTPGMSAGKIMHEVLEAIHSPGGSLNMDYASENLSSILDRFIEADKNIDARSGDGLTIKRFLNKIIRGYIENPEVHYGNVKSLETKFAWEPEPGLKIVGRIDRIDETDDGAELIDYKTRGSKKHKALMTRFSDVNHSDADLQLPIYFAAAEDVFSLEVGYMSLLPLEFKNGGAERVRFEIVSGESKGSKLSRALLRQVRKDIIELSRKVMSQTEFTIGEHTKCRDVYAGIICPYIHICDVAGG